MLSDKFKEIVKYFSEKSNISEPTKIYIYNQKSNSVEKINVCVQCTVRNTLSIENEQIFWIKFDT